MLLPNMIDLRTGRASARDRETRVDKPQIIVLEFPVTINHRSYVFEAQPFRLIRQITKEEYLRVLPNGYTNNQYYYEIHTD